MYRPSDFRPAQDAPCQTGDPEAWMAPETTKKGRLTIRACKQKCAECYQAKDCFLWIMHFEKMNGETEGVFGGYSRSERAKIRREHNERRAQKRSA